MHPGTDGLKAVPNYRMIVASQTGRVIRIVPEFPAVVLAYYDPQDSGEDPTHWQLRWQELNLIDGPRFSGGRDWFSFGPRYLFDEVQVRGVGVQRLGRNADRFGFTWAGYLVYVIRRDLATQMDSVDFYLFDYHQADAPRSRVLLQGNAPFSTRTDGPGASIGVEYPNVGDDESYEDPDGAACVAISGVRRKLPTRDGFGNLRLLPSGDPNVDPGVICVLTIRGPTPSDWRLDTLTPDELAVGPRKDPEAIMVGTGPDTKVFIFNREFDVATQTWRLHRTLAWEAP